MNMKLMAYLLTFSILTFTEASGYCAELTRLRVGSLTSGEFSQAYIAQKKGFFEKYGLAVELI
jgi:ABC-type nitrate/sulfonate/bicarbonate transport system substrate-binding protein